MADSFNMEVKTIFSEGFPGQETIRITLQLDTDLIVIGTQSYMGWNKLTGVPGSVAEYIVRYAPCAVLSIKQETLDKASSEYQVHDREYVNAKIH